VLICPYHSVWLIIDLCPLFFVALFREDRSLRQEKKQDKSNGDGTNANLKTEVTKVNAMSRQDEHDEFYAQDEDDDDDGDDLVQISPDITPVCSSFLDCCALVIPFGIHDTVVFACG